MIKRLWSTFGKLLGVLMAILTIGAVIGVMFTIITVVTYILENGL